MLHRQWKVSRRIHEEEWKRRQLYFQVDQVEVEKAVQVSLTGSWSAFRRDCGKGYCSLIGTLVEEKSSSGSTGGDALPLWLMQNGAEEGGKMKWCSREPGCRGCGSAFLWYTQLKWEKKAKDKMRNDDRMKVCGEMVCREEGESERAIRLARDCPSCLYINWSFLIWLPRVWLLPL